MTASVAPAARLAPQLAHNLLVNPGFEIWQRGAGPFTGDLAFSADEWWTVLNGGSVSIVPSAAAYMGAYCMSFDFTFVSASGGVRQGIENWRQLEGQWITFSVWVQSSVSCNAGINDWNGATQDAVVSNTHTGGGGWERLTVVKKIRTGLASGSASFPHGYGVMVHVFSGVSGLLLIDAATCAVGEYRDGVDFLPLNPADDMNRCQRFYEVHSGPYSVPGFHGMYANGGSQLVTISTSFNTRKAATPTMSKAGTWAVANCSQPAIYGQSMEGYGISVTSSGAGTIGTRPDSSDDKIMAEVT